ncbi:MAG: response regulator [Myxococcales bacterium]|nr:response regulator [Myxococcales bacterium]
MTSARALLLIVDDDMRSANVLGRLLQADGFDIEVTTDGAAALARLTRSPVPDALITDFHLAHVDGLAVGRYARSRRTKMPIFVVTGDPASVARAADPPGGPTVVLTKPVDYADLVVRLRAALPEGDAPANE